MILISVSFSLAVNVLSEESKEKHSKMDTDVELHFAQGGDDANIDEEANEMDSEQCTRCRRGAWNLLFTGMKRRKRRMKRKR